MYLGNGSDSSLKVINKVGIFWAKIYSQLEFIYRITKVLLYASKDSTSGNNTASHMVKKDIESLTSNNFL